MQRPKLHIVSFDIPYPADYGGVIDVFYKVKSLAEAGCEIYLHCFSYGRAEAKMLESYCAAVWYYPRLSDLRGISLRLPYITYSRRNKQLLHRLAELDAPILFEGIHSCFYANHPKLAGRKKLLRAHNVEHEYYKLLAQKTDKPLHRLYFRVEAALLRRMEHRLDGIDTILCLSTEDQKKFQQIATKKEVAFIAPFHPFDEQMIPSGMGTYTLYHGNLQHPENEEAVLFLLRYVIPKCADTQFIIAGRHPSEKIRHHLQELPNCVLITNPDGKEMNDLIQGAHINLLPTFQQSGMKLKLLYALFSGRHVIANDAMLYGTGLHDICAVANDAQAMIAAIQHLKTTPLDKQMRRRRAERLSNDFDNKKNAQRIITYLQPRSL